MKEPGKKLPGKWLKWLEEEAVAWQQDGIIDANQAGSILHRYDEMREKAEKEHGGQRVTG